MQRRLILASGSATRRMLLDRLRLQYEIVPADIDEQAQAGETARQLAQRLACQKASALSSQCPGALLIGSDQVALLDGQLVGKPGNFETACGQLLSASGKTMHFLTGLCLLNSATGEQQLRVSEYEVQFRSLHREQIEAYVRFERPFDCCGSFRAEGLGIALFEYHRGEDPTALLGLPLMALTEMLAHAGVDVLNNPV